MGEWPKRETLWESDGILYVSVPFTWRLPDVSRWLHQRQLFHERVVVGGPAIKLMPDFLSGIDGVTVDAGDLDGVLQRVNPSATRTSVGCSKGCSFCAVGKIEGAHLELDDWPDRPIIVDSNLLQCSSAHFDRVCDRLEQHGWADFNQGLDARLLTSHHAERIGRIGRAVCRLSLDQEQHKEAWERAFGRLRRVGVALKRIRSYVLVGHGTSPDEAWARCRWVEGHRVNVCPQWFHPLDALEVNAVTEEQRALGWDEAERKRLMGWFYQHRGEPPKSERGCLTPTA